MKTQFMKTRISPQSSKVCTEAEVSGLWKDYWRLYFHTEEAVRNQKAQETSGQAGSLVPLLINQDSACHFVKWLEVELEAISPVEMAWLRLKVAVLFWTLYLFTLRSVILWPSIKKLTQALREWSQWMHLEPWRTSRQIPECSSDLV